MTTLNKGGYADSRYQVSQISNLISNKTIAGTNAAQGVVSRKTAFSNIRALEAQASVYTAISGVFPLLSINKSSAGTGALVAFGTINLGTSVAGTTVRDITVTETNINDGDDIVLAIAAGTSATSPEVTVDLSYVEKFVSS